MFYRQKFVTNSSSTSFIFYGLHININDIREELPGNYDDYDNPLNKLAWNMEKDPKCKLAIHYMYEWEEFILYPKEAYIGLTESGVIDFPLQAFMVKTSQDTKEWNRLIKEFCDEMGIEYSTPGWQIACDVAR